MLRMRQIGLNESGEYPRSRSWLYVPEEMHRRIRVKGARIRTLPRRGPLSPTGRLCAVVSGVELDGGS
jgi:hypothetical protein